jgi:hypothetical protein
MEPVVAQMSNKNQPQIFMDYGLVIKSADEVL